MATPQEELAELNRQIADLKRQAGDASEFIPLQNLRDAQRLFTSLKNETSEIGENLSYVAQAFRDSVAELSKQNTELSASRSALKSISNTAQKIITTRSLEGDISSKELASLEKRAKLQFRSLEIAVKSGRIRGDALREAKDALKEEENFFNSIKGIREEQEIIGKNAGVKLFTGLEDITNAIPGLNKFTGAFKEASTAAKEQARFNKAAFGSAQVSAKKQKEINEALKNANGLSKKRITELGLENVLVNDQGKRLAGTAAKAKADALGLSKRVSKSVSPLTAGFKAIGPMLKKALGPLAILIDIVQAFTALDKRTGDTAKNLGISYQNAFALQKSFNRIANTSGNIMINSKGINEAFAAISKELGTNGQLSEELLLSQTRLVEQAFYSVEAATQLSKLSLALGENSEDITREFIGQVEALNAQNGLTVNSKQLLEASLKISKATLITLTAQKGELGRAAFEAKKLGLELSKLDSIADGLLSIESSISAEFEAEVISGRQLTLERARYYALTNDLAGVAKELSAQGITQEYYANASRIEQEAVAKAMGMSRDEMGAMLLEQKALSQIGVESAAKAKEKFEDLKAQYGIEGAIAKLGNEQYAQQLASASIADRFSKTMEKLKSVFSGIAEALMPLIDTLTIVFDLVGGIIKILDPILQITNLTLAGIADIVSLLKGDFDFSNITTAWSGATESMKGSWMEASSPLNAARVSSNMAIKSVGDAMIPAVSGGGNAIYSPTENTLYKGTINDVATLQPKNSINNNTRNQPSTVTLSVADVKAIADAVRDGAMQGTSRAKLVAEIEPRTIDRMSNSIQPYLATNTYSNSL